MRRSPCERHLGPLVRQDLSVVVCAPHSTGKLVRQAWIVLSVIVHPRGVYRTDFGSWPSSGKGAGMRNTLPVREQGCVAVHPVEPSAPHDGVVSGRYRALTKVMTVAGAAPDLNSLTGLPFNLPRSCDRQAPDARHHTPESVPGQMCGGGRL